MLWMQVLDFIRFRAVSDWDCAPGDRLRITFNIEYSVTPGFEEPKRGLITIDVKCLGYELARDERDFLDAIQALIGKVFMRVRGEDREVSILQVHGMPIHDWLFNRIRCM